MPRRLALARIDALIHHRSRVHSPDLTIAADAWRRDLEIVKIELPKRHVNAFHSISRETFETTIADLQASAEAGDPDARFVGLLRLLNLIGDGHTSVLAPTDRAYFPVEIKEFDSDLRVSRTAPQFDRALGSRVLALNGIPTSEVLRRVLELTPVDENASLRSSLATGYLTVGSILHGLGLIPNRARAVYSLQRDSETHEMELPASASHETADWRKPYSHLTLAEQQLDQSFTCSVVDNARAMYCAFRGYDRLGVRARTMFKLLRESGAERLIIDLRDNGGGDYTVGERKLIRPIQRLPSINRRGHLFVLIGPRTFSAAMNNAAQFRAMTSAILVGDTIGEKPNSYQEPRQLMLPNSHLIIRYSTRWYAFVKNGPNEVAPDVRITPSWEQYSLGRDPVLEYALDTDF